MTGPGLLEPHFFCRPAPRLAAQALNQTLRLRDGVVFFRLAGNDLRLLRRYGVFGVARQGGRCLMRTELSLAERGRIRNNLKNEKN